MDAKVIMVVLILVVWAVLVSASVQAARVETDEAQDQQPRANAIRIVVGANAASDEADCDPARPIWIQHDGMPTRDRIARVVCPSV